MSQAEELEKAYLQRMNQNQYALMLSRAKNKNKESYEQTAFL
jgi:hypothetical protein